MYLELITGTLFYFNCCGVVPYSTITSIDVGCCTTLLHIKYIHCTLWTITISINITTIL